MTNDMGFDLKLPAVGELTFPQWQDWLARYNAVLAERDSRIEKLEEALNCNLPDYDPKIGIVERLRQLGNWRVDGTKSSPIYNKSADHIEKLEAALRELSTDWDCCAVSKNMKLIARKALEDSQ